MKINIESRLDYEFAQPTDVLLQVEAAVVPEQIVDAHLEITPTEHFARVAAHDAIGDRIWVRAHGPLVVNYKGIVDVNRLLADVSTLAKGPDTSATRRDHPVSDAIALLPI